MVSERSVTGLKSVIYFLKGRKGKNFKIGKRKDRDMVSFLKFEFDYSFHGQSETTKKIQLLVSCHNSNFCEAIFFFDISKDSLQIQFCIALDFSYFLIFELKMTKNSKNAIFE